MNVNLPFFFSDVKLDKEGYLFEFKPGKQKVQLLKDFLVPVNTLEFEVFHCYKTVVEEELEIESSDRMWLTGVKETQEFESYFRHGPVGIKEIRKVPRFIADFLGYEPEKAKRFTGHSFRHSGATWLSNAGVSNLVLQKVLNHKNAKVSYIYTFCNFHFHCKLFHFQTAEEYIANSMLTKKSNAAHLSTAISNEGQVLQKPDPLPSASASDQNVQKIDVSENTNAEQIESVTKSLPGCSSKVKSAPKLKAESFPEAKTESVAETIEKDDSNLFQDDVDETFLDLLSQDTFDPNMLVMDDKDDSTSDFFRKSEGSDKAGNGNKDSVKSEGANSNPQGGAGNVVVKEGNSNGNAVHGNPLESLLGNRFSFSGTGHSFHIQVYNGIPPS